MMIPWLRRISFLSALALLLFVAAVALRAPRPDTRIPVVDDLRDALGDRARCPESSTPRRRSPMPQSWAPSQTAPAGVASASMRTMHSCLSCHDGAVVGSGRAMSHAAVTAEDGTPAGHPVGVDYASALAARPGEYQEPAANAGIRLENSKVTCISCHSSRDAVQSHTVGSQTQLCLSCHKK